MVINIKNFRIRPKNFFGFFKKINKKLKQIGVIKIAAEILVAKPIPEIIPDKKR